MNKNPDHTLFLKAFDELPFLIGKKTFVDFIKGNPNKTIENNHLDELTTYGALYLSEPKTLYSLLRQLLEQGYIEETMINGFPVIKKTSLGTKEIFEKKFIFNSEEQNSQLQKNFSLKHSLNPQKVTNKDKDIFKNLDFFLASFNDEQKKAIISDYKNILCIAGAGTGKTTVLTKRIEFLKTLKSVQEKNILAITFTRKARDEMLERLNKLGIYHVHVETFNSFCEKILKKNQKLFYKQETIVAQFKHKIAITKYALEKTNTHFEELSENYFAKKHLREKSRDELFFSLVHDLFSMLDHYKNSRLEITPFYEKETNFRKKKTAKVMYQLLKVINEELQNRGLRDFSDQCSDVLQLWDKHKETIPTFNHVLVDEFQDVNVVQLELLQKISTHNLFCVGDPRQAIYGWRGSQIQYILDFPKIFENAQVLSLTKNYRSNHHLVSFFNSCISSLNLEPLEATITNKEKELFVIEQDSELLEKIFVIEAIKNTQTPLNEIFVLGRTNKIIEQFAEEFAKQKIPFAIKSEDEYKNKPQEEALTLATLHSIKGMEAEEVYIVGATSNNFPNKVQDNFVISLIKEDDLYDKEAEELRLFYVGVSRAKQKLVITYTGNHSKFITNEMLEISNFKPKQKTLFHSKSPTLENSNSTTIVSMLKSWRMEKATNTGLPAYMILSNKTLEEIAQKLPLNKNDLQEVSGLGPLKVAKFGDEILKIIQGN